MKKTLLFCWLAVVWHSADGGALTSVWSSPPDFMFQDSPAPSDPFMKAMAEIESGRTDAALSTLREIEKRLAERIESASRLKREAESDLSQAMFEDAVRRALLGDIATLAGDHETAEDHYRVANGTITGLDSAVQRRYISWRKEAGARIDERLKKAD